MDSFPEGLPSFVTPRGFDIDAVLQASVKCLVCLVDTVAISCCIQTIRKIKHTIEDVADAPSYDETVAAWEELGRRRGCMYTI